MDVAVLLVIILIVAVIWRGPKTLPQLGAMLGRTVRAARDEASKTSSKDKDDSGPS